MDSAMTDVMHDQPISAGASRVPTLPIEIEEEIIKWLDSNLDNDTLTKCARVCKSWLPRCRHKLYNEIIIWDSDQWERFAQLLSQPPQGIIRYLEATKELSIDILSTLRNPWNGKQRMQLSKLLADYAPRFLGLESLGLIGILWRHSSLIAMPSSNYYQKLTSLDLQYCSFENALQLHEVISRLPALSNLHIRSISFKFQTVIPPNAKSRSRGPKLSYLDLYFHVEDTGHQVLDCLVMSGMVQRLVTFVWSSPCFTPEELRALKSMLQATEELKTFLCTEAGPAEVEGKSLSSKLNFC